MRRTITFSAALLAAGLALAGCSAAPNSAGSITTVEGSARDVPLLPAQPFDGGTVQSEPLPQDAPQDAAASTADRQVVTTGWMSVTVDAPVEASVEAVRITTDAGGRVDSRTETAPVNGDQGSASLTLRVPADRLTAVVDELRTLGTVQEVSLSEADVTMQTQDLDARIAALTASIDRMLGLVSTAADINAVIALETAISDRQAELESLDAQRRSLADQVAMSTITLSLVSVADAPPQNPDTFWSGLATGWNAFIGFFAGLVVAAGVLLPWIVLLGLVAAVVIVVVRRRRAVRAAATPPVERSESVEPSAERTPPAE